jgi:translation initiation factor IF-3
LGCEHGGAPCTRAVRVHSRLALFFAVKGGVTIRSAIIRRNVRFQDVRRDEPRVNYRIRIPEVRVVGADGSQLGIMDTRDAQALAEEQNLDLVEVAPTARPPVCRIMDYGKFKFEQAKKSREAKAKQHRVKVKEVKMKLKISQHDHDFKVRHAIQFLKEGNKVKFRVIFRGRELSRPERGRQLIDQIIEELKDYAVIDSRPNHAGREMVMVLAPKPGLREKVKAEAKKAQEKMAKEAAADRAPDAPETTTDEPVAKSAGRAPKSIMAVGLDRARQQRDQEDVEEPATEEKDVDS